MLAFYVIIEIQLRKPIIMVLLLPSIKNISSTLNLEKKIMKTFGNLERDICFRVTLQVAFAGYKR